MTRQARHIIFFGEFVVAAMVSLLMAFLVACAPRFYGYLAAGVWASLLIGPLIALIIPRKHRPDPLILVPVLRIIGTAMTCSMVPPSLEPRQLQWVAAPMIEKIESFRARTGRYPWNLGEVQVEPPELSCGGFRYSSRGDSFGLSIGDYDLDGFALEYDSDEGWHVDM